MKVHVVTGHTDLHDSGFEDGVPAVFLERDDAEKLVKSEYEKWRKEYEDCMSWESVMSGLATDTPPCHCGAGFRTDRDDVFDWTITECDIFGRGEVVGPVIA